MSHTTVGEGCLALNDERLQLLKARRRAGESWGVLARDVGVPWQRLWSLLHGQPPGRQGPVLRRSSVAGALVERYRPSRLDEIWGQAAVVSVLRRFVAGPHPAAFLLEGETGTGKTSAAVALAAELGCDVAAGEFGGLWSIASGEQSADAVRETCRRMHTHPWQGSGWKVVVVNEADRMARPAETVWLDALERIPPQTVLVFTTNEPERLSQRFLDRCTRLAFESSAEQLRPTAEALAAAVW